MSSVTSVASTSSFTTSIASTTSKDNTEIKSVVSPKNSGDSKSSNDEYHCKLKSLNLAVLDWIKSHLDKNPLVILSPIFKDYEKHLTEIQKSAVSSSNKVQILSDFKFNSADSKSREEINSKISGNVFASPPAKAATPAEASKVDPPKATYSFGASTAEGAPKTTFSFGTKKTDDIQPSTFTFGTKAPENSSKSFSFGSNPSNNAGSTGFSFDSKSSVDPKSTFSFGSKPTTGDTASFSFGSGSKAHDTKDEHIKPAFSFGTGASTSPTTGFSFTGATKPFSFSGSTQPTNSSEDANKEEAEENDEPPKVEFTQVEESDSIYSKKCKVFVKNEDKFGDRGVGTLHLKPVDGQQKTQLIVRADTNIGNLLLNMILNESVPTKRMGKKDVLLVAAPMPTDKKPTQILIRVKTEEEADQLLKTLEKQKNPE